MDISANFDGFTNYLKQSDPTIFEVFKDQGSLGWRPDPENPQVYQLMILMGDHYYTDEQKDRLFALWNAYLGVSS